jgi:hypothetical protein
MRTITTGITNPPTAQSWDVIDVEASLVTYSPTVTRTLIIYPHVLPNLQKEALRTMEDLVDPFR